MRVTVCCGLALGLVLLAALAAEPILPTEAAAELVHNEKLLKSAGIATDGNGLLAYFRSRSLSAADQVRLKQAIVLLGDESFEKREQASRDLLAAGRFSLPYLKPHTNDPDLERARRVERCIEEIEQAPYAALLTAAAQLAAVRKPAGVTEAMLTCLPWVDDEMAQESVFSALTATGVQDGKVEPALLDAAKDRESVRRAAAAFVLGRVSGEARQQAVRLLADVDPRVRFYAATSLLRTGERAAVSALVAQLTDGPVPLAWQAEDLLCRVAGDKQPDASAGNWDEAGRKKCREVWEAWWKLKQNDIDLAKINFEDSYLGLNVIAELDGSGKAASGRIVECGPDRKDRWQIDNVVRPIDAVLLPGGRILVAEHGQARVSERDREGKILWEHKTQNQPVTAQRLPNGNTFIVTYNELLEVTPTNKVIYSHSGRAMIFHGQKLRNGNMVYVTGNSQVVELDPAGKQIRSINVGNTSGWASVEKLPNSHYLVALYSGRKVVEVDENGKVFWECACESPGHATRLRNGNTLVASIEGRKVLEYNRAGEVVWSKQTQGRPFHARRR